MPLSDLFSMTIQTTGPGVSRPGFGTPNLLGASMTWSERLRFFSSSSALAAALPDGVDAPEYKAGIKMLSQSPRPPRIAVSRRANKPTQAWDIVINNVNSTVYNMTFGDEDITYTSDSSATKDEIAAGLKTAIDALSLAVTVTNPGSVGSKTLHIVANTAGAWFQLGVEDPSLLSVTEVTADINAEDDLEAIAGENGDWYAIANLWHSSAEITAIATWAEANNRFFLSQTQDSAVATVAAGSATDIAKTLSDGDYARTALVYHNDNGQFVDCAWLGRWLPTIPGTETAAFKTLATVQPDAKVTLSETYQTNLEANNCNYYATHKGVAITYPGKVCAGEWMDITRGVDSFKADCEADIFALQVQNDKIPLDDFGISMIQGAILGELKRRVGTPGSPRLFAASPAPFVNVPKAADLSEDDRSNRRLTGVEFGARFSGAIHAVTLTGQLSS